jgi:hypothetical protein
MNLRNQVIAMKAFVIALVGIIDALANGSGNWSLYDTD